MIPRLVEYLFGPSWRTSLIGLLAAIAYAAQSVPAILDGTATSADYVRAAVAALIYALGRTAADARTRPLEDTAGQVRRVIMEATTGQEPPAK